MPAEIKLYNVTASLPSKNRASMGSYLVISYFFHLALNLTPKVKKKVL